MGNAWGPGMLTHTVLIFLDSGTGVSGSEGVRSLESSDVCFGTGVSGLHVAGQIEWV